MSGNAARNFAILAASASLAAPAYASDFTGMGTFLAALYGLIFLVVAGGMFAISYAADKGPMRKGLRWGGVALGVALTLWWVVEPMAEGSALLIVIGVLSGTFLFAALSRKAHPAVSEKSSEI